jgi:hypothetical protein
LYDQASAGIDRLLNALRSIPSERRDAKAHTPVSAPTRKIRIADLSWDKPSQAPMGCMVSFSVSVANVSSVAVTITSFEIRFTGTLAADSRRWLDPRPNPEGFARMTHLFRRGAEVLGKTIEMPTYNPAIRLAPGDFIREVGLRAELMWTANGADDGTRYRAVICDLRNECFELRASLSDGSYSTWTT